MYWEGLFYAFTLHIIFIWKKGAILYYVLNQVFNNRFQD
jgi:hypothetical protein